MFYIAVCDDEEYFRTREEQLIMKYMDIKGYHYKIEIFKSGDEILNLGNGISKFDMIFLAINREGIDGIETAKRIRRVTKDIYIVFVTAFVTYALEGYKVDAVRYLLKDDKHLEKAMYECLNTIIYKINIPLNFRKVLLSFITKIFCINYYTRLAFAGFIKVIW